MKIADPNYDFSELNVDEMFMLARRANTEVFERALPIVQKVARAYCRRYEWINQEDLVQDLMCEVPRVMYGYREDNDAGNVWSKYLYWRLQFKAKDVLRREDPLGISHPQKRKYPAWHRLGDESLDGFDPKDHRESVASDELLEDVAIWKEYFSHLRPIRKIKRDRHWDKAKSRVKFKRLKVTIFDWYRLRKSPRQMELTF
jgi:DNA-directed RNA polymerase specialized sigma24 family protein